MDDCGGVPGDRIRLSIGAWKCHRNTRGIALISTLAILALLTIMVVSFVSVVSQDRGATQSYTQSLRAQEIALGGLDQVVSQLRAEITDPANNASTNGSGTNAIYIPNAVAAVPQRMVTNALAPMISMSGTNMYGTLTNFSSPGSFTTAASLNNRSISLARWCKPQFLFPSATNVFTPPNWVIVTRSGPQAFASGTIPSAAGLTVSSFTNMNAAIGRYAYVVYDVSGLLDATVAGYPNSAAMSASTNKGVLPWANLAQLNSSAITTNDIDSLVNWRNATNYGSYAAYVTNWATNGFMEVAPGDTTFLSRQELIQYAQTQNPDLTNALPYLTTFSRELNGPTWGPTTNAVSTGPYAYQANQTNTSVTTTNVLIFNPKVEGAGGWTRQNGTPAVAGEPLVKYRFPLDKLALLNEASPTTADQATIKKYFGLIEGPGFTSPTYRHWIYTNPLGSAAATSILTLNQVANLASREPDFFELLQAGILSGSLGQYGRGDALPTGGYYGSRISLGWTDPDARSDYQIIRIGANIIDQTHADNYPTTITYGGQDFYGIEDLPYINEFFVKAIGTGPNPSSAPVPGPPYTLYLYFELWNPHQQMGIYTNYPTNFRIAPITGPGALETYRIGIQTAITANSETMSYWYPDGSGGWNTPASLSRYFTNLPSVGTTTALSGGNITFTAAGTGTSSYREPALIPGTPPWTSAPPIAALNLGSFSYPPNGTYARGSTTVEWGVNPPATQTFFQDVCISLGLAQVVFQIQYLDSGSNWRTYGTFEGLANTNATAATQSGYWSVPSLIPVPPTASTDANSFPKSDPRTFRFGSGDNTPWLELSPVVFANSAGTSLTPALTTVDSPVSGGICPFLSNVSLSVTTPYRLDMWSVNDATVPVQGASYSGSAPPYSYTPTYSPQGLPYYLDRDGTQRVGDARYSYVASPPSSPLFANATPNRPVILHRPFQSVGELGYVFRDMPWKTLDLFSPNSADAALLDLFSVSEATVMAGRVNPNTAPAPVLSALLSGAAANYSGSNTNLTASSATAISAAITTAVSTAPLLNRSSLVNSFMTNTAVANAFPSGIKTERESVVRALAESANTRTWNFMVDVIAQSGSYPTTARTLDDFNVTGERRYWLHIAIDRYTGQIVDKQLEVVNQ